MHPLLAAALSDAEPLIAARGWVRPADTTLRDADRLLGLLAHDRPPTVLIEPAGTVQLAWEAAHEGWLTLTVDGDGHLTHSAVIGEDEFEQTEVFVDVLPGWASELLERLLRKGH